MKERLLQIRDTIAAAYTQLMAEAKKTSWRLPVSNLQQPSTQKALGMTPEQLLEYNSRPAPTNWEAAATGTRVENDLDVKVGRRAITPYEEYNYKWLQHRTEGRNTLGQSTASSVDEAKRAQAVSKFMSCCGTGRKYEELTAAEKQRVKSYFLDIAFGRPATLAEYEAFKTNDTKMINEMIAVAVGAKSNEN